MRPVRAGPGSSSPARHLSSHAPHPSLPDLSRMCLSATHRRPIQQPSSLNPVPIVGCCVPVVTRTFHFRTRLRPGSTRSWPTLSVVTSYVPVVARCTTHRRDPSPSRPIPIRANPISMRARLFLCTLSKHPGLHLPRKLLARFSTGC